MVSEWFARVKWIENLQKLGLTGVILAGAMYVGQEMLENDRQFRESIVENDRQFREQSIATQRSFAGTLEKIVDASVSRDAHLTEASRYMRESAERETRQVEVLGKILDELKQPEASRTGNARDGG